MLFKRKLSFYCFRLIQESLKVSSAKPTSEPLTDNNQDTFKYLPVVQDTSNGKFKYTNALVIIFNNKKGQQQ